MCYSDEDRPPEAPGIHTPARGEDLVLTSHDGNRFSAYAAWPSTPTGATVIIYPDVRGLHHFYKSLALRFAEVGITALAIDYFGRTAGLTARDDAFEFWPHVQQIQFDNFGGHWGDQAKLDKFLQAYAAEKAKIEARKRGHSVTEQSLADGSIKLTIEVGGGAV